METYNQIIQGKNKFFSMNLCVFICSYDDFCSCDLVCVSIQFGSNALIRFSYSFFEHILSLFTFFVPCLGVLWQAMETLLRMLERDNKSPDVFITMQVMRSVASTSFNYN